jgi:hypothetical protein
MWSNKEEGVICSHLTTVSMVAHFGILWQIIHDGARFRHVQ